MQTSGCNGEYWKWHVPFTASWFCSSCSRREGALERDSWSSWGMSYREADSEPGDWATEWTSSIMPRVMAPGTLKTRRPPDPQSWDAPWLEEKRDNFIQSSQCVKRRERPCLIMNSLSLTEANILPEAAKFVPTVDPRFLGLFYSPKLALRQLWKWWFAHPRSGSSCSSTKSQKDWLGKSGELSPLFHVLRLILGVCTRLLFELTCSGWVVNPDKAFQFLCGSLTSLARSPWGIWRRFRTPDFLFLL